MFVVTYIQEYKHHGDLVYLLNYECKSALRVPYSCSFILVTLHMYESAGYEYTFDRNVPTML